MRDLNEEVTVWTGSRHCGQKFHLAGAAIYRRFHPACAASYMLRADGGDDRQQDVVEGYADGWRAPKALAPKISQNKKYKYYAIIYKFTILCIFKQEMQIEQGM